MVLLVHGGAGFKRPSKKHLHIISETLSSGFGILRIGGTALDAVTESVKSLEDSGSFNAGSGGNLQFDGVRRLDASIMDGKYLSAGSVVNLEDIQNPVLAARIIMDLPHVTLTHNGARRIADAHNLPRLPEPDKRAFEKLKKVMKKGDHLSQIYDRYFSTVGAVAIDAYGNLAAGSSTGGIPGMLPGRVGDTPIIGSGIYADNSVGAVACTGSGEAIIRLVLSKEICMTLQSFSPLKAATISLRRILALNGHAGAIVLDRLGRFAIIHTTDYLASGYATNKAIMVKHGFHQVSLFRRTPSDEKHR